MVVLLSPLDLRVKSQRVRTADLAPRNFTLTQQVWAEARLVAYINGNEALVLRDRFGRRGFVTYPELLTRIQQLLLPQSETTDGRTE